jgi:hypothetical protein
VNNELGSVFKEVVVVQLKVVSYCLVCGTKENQEECQLR